MWHQDIVCGLVPALAEKLVVCTQYGNSIVLNSPRKDSDAGEGGGEAAAASQGSGAPCGPCGGMRLRQNKQQFWGHEA